MQNDADNFRFHVQPSPDDPSPAAFQVTGFDGEEEISRNYRFEIDLVSDDPNVDLAKLVHRQATLSLSFNQTRNIHGIIASIEQGGNPSPGIFVYQAVLVPQMTKLALSTQSQIYGTMGDVNVVDVVKTELTGSNARGTADTSAAWIDPAFVEFILPDLDVYQKRDYIVQHQESDLAFVSRLLEHYGIFYYFDQSQEQEKLILGDHNSVFGAVIETGDNASDTSSNTAATLSFQQPTGRIPHGKTSVHELTRHRQPLPQKLILRDYNYRIPQGMGNQPMYLHAEATVDPAGHGVVVGYGDHFRNHDEGQMLARVRAQEMACTQETFTGSSDCYTFSAGHVFALEDHFSDACNQHYLITRLRHRGGQRYSLDDPDAEPEAFAYTNQFTAIPADTPYRPERRTPKPVVHGVVNAHVDAAGAGSRAEIDGEGRYKIRLPFDLAGSSDGMGSRYMRMAQPYSGGTSDSGNPSGFHFPLMKGTEVMCTCVNGDPDRPIIAGTVPNPKTRAPVTQENSTKNIIRTASGIRMEFDDGRGSDRKSASSKSQNDASLAEQQFQQGKLTEPLGLQSQQDGHAESSDKLFHYSAFSDLSEQAPFAVPVSGYSSAGTNHRTLTQQQHLNSPASTTPKTPAQKKKDLQSTGETDVDRGNSTNDDIQYDISDPLWKINIPNNTNKYYFGGVEVPRFDTGSYTFSSSPARSYIRRGKADLTEIVENAYYGGDQQSGVGGDSGGAGVGKGSRKKGVNHPGGFDFIDGNRVEWTTGDRDIVVEGRHRFAIAKGGINMWDEGPLFYSHLRDTGGGNYRQTTVEQASAETVTFGESKTVEASSSYELKVSADSNWSLGASVSGRAGVDLNVFAGFTADFKYAGDYTYQIGTSIDHSRDKSITASDSINLYVYNGKSKIANKKFYQKLAVQFGAVMGGFATFAAAITGAVTLAAKDYDDLEGKDKDKLKQINSWLEGLRAGGVAAFAGIVPLAMDYRKLQVDSKLPLFTGISINKDRIKLENHKDDTQKIGTSLSINDDGIVVRIDGVPVLELNKDSLHVFGDLTVDKTITAETLVAKELNSSESKLADPAAIPTVLQVLKAAKAKAVAETVKEEAKDTAAAAEAVAKAATP